MPKPSRHRRNLSSMQAAPRCGAKTRAGAACQAPSIAGASRCRMHGGKGSGAPHGNHNALKHGCYTGPMLEQAAEVRAMVRRARMVLRAWPASRMKPRDDSEDTG